VGVVIERDPSVAAVWFRRAADQGCPRAFLYLGRILLSEAAVGRALPTEPGEAARFLAQAAQQTGDEESRLEALAALSKYAHEPDVVKACRIGCGKTPKLRACSKCLTARFCGTECVRHMSPVDKQCCKTFAAAWRDATAAAKPAVDGGARTT